MSKQESLAGYQEFNHLLQSKPDQHLKILQHLDLINPDSEHNARLSTHSVTLSSSDEQADHQSTLLGIDFAPSPSKTRNGTIIISKKETQKAIVGNSGATYHEAAFIPDSDTLEPILLWVKQAQPKGGRDGSYGIKNELDIYTLLSKDRGRPNYLPPFLAIPSSNSLCLLDLSKYGYEANRDHYLNRGILPSLELPKQRLLFITLMNKLTKLTRDLDGIGREVADIGTNGKGIWIRERGSDFEVLLTDFGLCMPNSDRSIRIQSFTDMLLKEGPSLTKGSKLPLLEYFPFITINQEEEKVSISDPTIAAITVTNGDIPLADYLTSMLQGKEDNAIVELWSCFITQKQKHHSFSDLEGASTTEPLTPKLIIDAIADNPRHYLTEKALIMLSSKTGVPKQELIEQITSMK